jgi:transposase InsO family protein
VRKQVVELARSGTRVAQLAETFGMSEAVIYGWLKQERIDRGEAPGLSTEGQMELAAAKRRIRQLETELAVSRKVNEVHPTREGKVHCCAVIDAFSRMVVGWSTGLLVTNALGMALNRRAPREGGIIHSDQGAQFASWVFSQKVTEAGLAPRRSDKLPYSERLRGSSEARLPRQTRPRSTSRRQISSGASGLVSLLSQR